MSRDIKFRAWDEDKNDWAICKVFLDTTETNPREQGVDKNLILRTRSDNIILEQYTGLKDKNGKEIYESDILRTYGEYNIPENREVIYSKKGYWIPLVSVEYGHNTMDDYYSEDFEVIGNIHENPELLKVTL